MKRMWNDHLLVTYWAEKGYSVVLYYRSPVWHHLYPRLWADTNTKVVLYDRFTEEPSEIQFKTCTPLRTIVD